MRVSHLLKTLIHSFARVFEFLESRLPVQPLRRKNEYTNLQIRWFLQTSGSSSGFYCFRAQPERQPISRKRFCLSGPAYGADVFVAIIFCSMVLCPANRCRRLFRYLAGLQQNLTAGLDHSLDIEPFTSFKAVDNSNPPVGFRLSTRCHNNHRSCIPRDSLLDGAFLL